DDDGVARLIAVLVTDLVHVVERLALALHDRPPPVSRLVLRETVAIAVEFAARFGQAGGVLFGIVGALFRTSRFGGLFHVGFIEREEEDVVLQLENLARLAARALRSAALGGGSSSGCRFRLWRRRGLALRVASRFGGFLRGARRRFGGG